MRSILLGMASLVALLLAGEAVARLYFGLGTPALLITHPKIEYMFAPDQDVYRFGNRQLYNEYGMRSGRLASKQQRQRVLVFGDSVVNGGNLTDHAALATTLLTDDNALYGNVSAGSWGPANMVGWIDVYGFLGAQTAVVVLSSHDLNDLPTFQPLDQNTHPTERPPLALAEAVQRYLPRYLRQFFWSSEHVQVSALPKAPEDGSAGRKHIVALIDSAADANVGLCLIQHQTMSELRDGPLPEHGMIADLFAARGVPTLDLAVGLKARIDDGDTVYRDDIHINSQGQVVLVDYMRQCSAMARIPI